MRRRAVALSLAVLPLAACFGDVFGDYALRGGGEGGGPIRGHDTAGSAGVFATGGSAGESGGGAGASAGGEGGEGVGGGGASGSAGASGTGGQGSAGGPALCSGQDAWACDPVATAPCKGDGSACDIDVGKAVFSCFPPPNTLSLGDPCKLEGPDFCSQGGTCLNGACARFCCDDGACNGKGTCQPGNLPGVVVGLCACDPAIVASLGGTLDTLAQQYAPGAAKEGASLCGAIASGESIQRAVTLVPSRCYTAVAVASSSSVDLVLTLGTMTTGAGGAPPTMLASSGVASPAPVLGDQPNCYRPQGTAPIDAVFRVSGAKNAGNVMAQLYSK